MTNKIKIRAWDLKRKKMISNPIINDIDSATSYIGLNTLFEKYSEEGFEIMQYIGIKDKNDIEVYEGDIIEAKSAFSNDRSKHQVVWNAKGCAFRLVDSNGISFGGDESVLNYDDWEVIGNIYDRTKKTNI